MIKSASSCSKTRGTGSLLHKLLLPLFFSMLLTIMVMPIASQAQEMSGTYIIGPEGDYTTLTDALSDIREHKVDGEIILEVEPGIYEESLEIGWIQTSSFQTANQGFTIRSTTGNAEDVILRAGGFSTEFVVSIHANNSNFTFENFTIQSTDFNTQGVVLDGRGHLFRGMIFIGSGISDARHSSTLHIENCTFQGASIAFLGANRTPGLGDVHIIGNTFRNGSIAMNRLRGDYTISDNVIYANRTGIHIQNAPVNGKIFNNYVLAENELHGREGLFLHTVDSVLVYHNTLKTLRGNPLKVSGEANIHLNNNILFATTDFVVDLEYPESVTSDHNGFYTSGDDVARVGEFREWDVYETLTDFISATGHDANSIFRDPRFDFDAEDDLERMMPGTTAFETAGMDLTEAVPEDMMGNPRPDTPSLGALEYTGTETSTSEPAITALPDQFSLSGTYPNPFNPSTTISYELYEPTDIILTVFDAYGRRIATLVDERQAAGNHTSVFNATGLASGLYIYRLSSASHSLTGKMVLVK